MAERNVQSVLENLCDSRCATEADLEYLLAQNDRDATRQIARLADEVRSRYAGDGIILRGLVEFSNFCARTCAYCGLNRYNTVLPRYRMTEQQILESVNDIAEAGIKTVVLQSGEDVCLNASWLAQVVEEIKDEFDIAVTLSIGERDTQDYRLWKQAGADRYLLKIETTNPAIYNQLHPGMSLENRRRCLLELKSLGFQTGSGSIVGLKNQTYADLAQDILFFTERDFDMVGIGPFIPHPQTSLAEQPQGDLGLTLRTLALTRILTRDTHLPATTAVRVAGRSEAFESALAAGANVVMINFPPPPFRKLYEIYPTKKGSARSPGWTIKKLENIADRLGRYISYSRADSLKDRHEDVVQTQT